MTSAIQPTLAYIEHELATRRQTDRPSNWSGQSIRRVCQFEGLVETEAAYHTSVTEGGHA